MSGYLNSGVSYRTLTAIFIAVVMHWSLSRVPVSIDKSETRSASKEVEVERWEPPSEEERSVVNTSRAETQTEEGKARFFGEFKQRVTRETQSREKGAMREGREIDPEGQAVRDGLGGLLMRGAANPNTLPDDIEEGGQTVLNTDPVMYASFINRISDEIYGSWIENVQEVMARYEREKRPIETNTYITRLEILLSPRGDVLSIKTLKGSGISLLDEAPKKAFWSNEPFPNPPTQMIEDTEMARFVYEFRFDWNSSGFQIIPKFL